MPSSRQRSTMARWCASGIGRRPTCPEGGRGQRLDAEAHRPQAGAVHRRPAAADRGDRGVSRIRTCAAGRRAWMPSHSARTRSRSCVNSGSRKTTCSRPRVSCRQDSSSRMLPTVAAAVGRLDAVRAVGAELGTAARGEHRQGAADRPAGERHPQLTARRDQRVPPREGQAVEVVDLRAGHDAAEPLSGDQPAQRGLWLSGDHEVAVAREQVRYLLGRQAEEADADAALRAATAPAPSRGDDRPARTARGRRRPSTGVVGGDCDLVAGVTRRGPRRRPGERSAGRESAA